MIVVPPLRSEVVVGKLDRPVQRRDRQSDRQRRPQVATGPAPNLDVSDGGFAERLAEAS
jgi:hypothetical protein